MCCEWLLHAEYFGGKWPFYSGDLSTLLTLNNGSRLSLISTWISTSRQFRFLCKIVLMLFALQCTDYKNILTLTLTLKIIEKKTVEHGGVATVYPNKYAHGFVVLCFVVVMQSFIMNSHEVFIHIHQGCFAGTGAIVRLPQCQWSKPDGYGKISQFITTTKHSKAKTVCIFLGTYCMYLRYISMNSLYL